VVALCLASTASAQPRRRPPPSPPPPEFISVTVRAGETCAALARRVYRAPTRTDVIHQFNPTVCPPQRRLTAGLVLRLPRRLPLPPRPSPVAWLTALSNAVQVQTPPTAQPRAARSNDALFRGTRVSTEARSSAELTFQDETQLRLYESTLVVILGDTSTRVRRTATARDTTLVNGSLRAFLGELANGPSGSAAVAVGPVIGIVGRRPPPRRAPPRRPTQVAINTAGGRAILRDGESQLSVSDGTRASTTLTVYRGSGQLRSGAQTVTVPEGFGARAEVGERIAPVHRLPLAPAWIAPPPRVLLDPSPTLAGAYAPGVTPPGDTGAPAPAEWHVQVARDDAFTALESDARSPLAVDHLSAPLSPGEHFVRVSALDADHYEGPFGAVARVAVVSTALTPTAEPYRESLSLPAGVRCAIDGEPVAAGSATVLDRLRPHALRCTPEGEEAAAEATLARAVRAPYRVSATLEEADPVARRGRVRVRLLDRSDVAYAEAAFAAQARGGPVSADEGRATDAAGEWMVPVRWSVGATSFSLHLTLAAADAVDTDDLALPRPPPPPVLREGFAQRLSVRAEGLYANMLSEYQRNADRDTSGVFMGNAKAITHGLAGSLRLGLDLRRPDAGTSGLVFGLELFADGVLFPREEGPPGVSTLLGAGVRLAPYNGAVQPWVSAGAGAALTGGLLRFGFEAGLGVDFRLSRAVSLGPVVRYVQVVEVGGDPAIEALTEDARMIQVGVGLTLRLPRGR
jgi:hypothetical protein